MNSGRRLKTRRSVSDSLTAEGQVTGMWLSLMEFTEECYYGQPLPQEGGTIIIIVRDRLWLYLLVRWLDPLYRDQSLTHDQGGARVSKDEHSSISSCGKSRRPLSFRGLSLGESAKAIYW